jgi:hypothetical protein
VELPIAQQTTQEGHRLSQRESPANAYVVRRIEGIFMSMKKT